MPLGQEQPFSSDIILEILSDSHFSKVEIGLIGKIILKMFRSELENTRYQSEN